MSVINVADVTKIYSSPDGSAVTALDKVSLRAEPGQIVSLLGPSGCGKSTLLNIVSGMDTVTSGTATVYEETPSPDRRVGMLFQKSSLLPWRTALENVLLPSDILGLDREESLERARSLLDTVGLGNWHDHYPRQLSGGMQQRVAVARVLLPDPEILLLDEPFGALDEMNREMLDLEICRVVEQTGKTVLLVTHSVYEAVLVSDVIYTLTPHPGRVAGITNVDLPHPRTIDVTGTDAFADIVADARRLLKEGALEPDEVSN